MKNSPYIDELLDFEKLISREYALTLQQNRTQGEQDGRRNLPAVSDDTIPPQEQQLLAIFQSKVEEVSGVVRYMLHEVKHTRLQPALTALQHWSPAEVAGQIGQARQTRDERLEVAAENHFDRLKVLENTPAYSRAKQDIEAAENRLNATAQHLGRYELFHKISPFWAVTIAVSIGILEIPLNNRVFAMFREPNTTMTLLLSLSLVVVMPIIAHIGGRLFRQGGERRSNYFVAAALSLGVVMLSYFAALLRTDAIKDAPDASTPFFLVLNLLFFAAAAVASFQAHDPSIALSDAHRAVRKARRQHRPVLADSEKQIQAETTRYQQEKEDIQQEFSRHETAALNSQQTLQKDAHEAMALYNQILSVGQGLERTLQTYSHAVILSRREENLKFRTNHAQPQCWKAPLPPLDLSLRQLTEIDWPE